MIDPSARIHPTADLEDDVWEAGAIVTQTGDSPWRELDPAWFPRLAVVVD